MIIFPVIIIFRFLLPPDDDASVQSHGTLLEFVSSFNFS